MAWSERGRHADVGAPGRQGDLAGHEGEQPAQPGAGSAEISIFR
jgi:hypothetical protein